MRLIPRLLALVTAGVAATGFVADRADAKSRSGNYSEYVFVFEHTNGSLTRITGSNKYGEEGYTGKATKAYLPTAGGMTVPGTGMYVHVSCSDPFTGGWGTKAGPSPVDDPEWRIVAFKIDRYKWGKFFKTCGWGDHTVPASGAPLGTIAIVGGLAAVGAGALVVERRRRGRVADDA